MDHVARSCLVAVNASLKTAIVSIDWSVEISTLGYASSHPN